MAHLCLDQTCVWLISWYLIVVGSQLTALGGIIKISKDNISLEDLLAGVWTHLIIFGILLVDLDSSFFGKDRWAKKGRSGESWRRNKDSIGAITINSGFEKWKVMIHLEKCGLKVSTINSGFEK